MPTRVSRLLDRAGLRGSDIALAVLLAAAGAVWAVHTGYRGPGDQAIVPIGPMTSVEPYQSIFDGADRPAIGPAVLINIAAALPLAVRRRFPYAAFAASLGGIFILHNGLTWPGFVAVVIAAYSAVAYGRSLWVALTLLLSGAAIAAQEFANSIPPIPGWLGPFVILAPAGLAAATIRSARARADASARRALALEQERDATGRAAIAEERARIARELHDVVSHHVSVIVIQAGAAGKVIEARPDLAAGALRAIEASGREAMGELRHLLGLVAPVDDRLHPQPGLGDLDALIGSVRAAGQPVSLHGDPGEVPRGIDLTAYRVVQEGLTNALRYAPGAATAVDVRRDGDTLVIEVRNDRPATTGPAHRVGTGSGLVGLAERLRLLDGTLEAGRRLDGGFRITARIPVASTVESA